MNVDCLQHLLTEDERRKFDSDGYFVVKHALAPDAVATIIETIDSLYGGGSFDASGDPSIANRVDHVGFMHMSPEFVDLIDHPRTFPKVWGILGWNIYSYSNHLVITPPVAGRYDPDGPTFRFHQDSGRVTLDMPELDVPARLSLKVGFFLSDASEPGSGNIWVVPSSHLARSIEVPAAGVGQPEGALPVRANAGDAILFDRRIWHAATPNYVQSVRRFLVYGYGYRWIRIKGDFDIPEAMLRDADPVRRQLLGYSQSEGHRYGPAAEDVPLREWLREHQPEAVSD